MILETISEYINVYYVMAYVIIHWFTAQWAMWMCSNVYYNRDEERDKKYWPFRRTDLDKWNTLKTCPWWLLFWPRFIGIGIIIVIYYIWIRIVMFGHKSGAPVSPLKRYLT